MSVPFGTNTFSADQINGRQQTHPPLYVCRRPFVHPKDVLLVVNLTRERRRHDRGSVAAKDILDGMMCFFIFVCYVLFLSQVFVSLL